jgi:hypothetical protein
MLACSSPLIALISFVHVHSLNVMQSVAPNILTFCVFSQTVSKVSYCPVPKYCYKFPRNSVALCLNPYIAVSLSVKWQSRSGASGPLGFGSGNGAPLVFLGEEALVYEFQNYTFFYICNCDFSQRLKDFVNFGRPNRKFEGRNSPISKCSFSHR